MSKIYQNITELVGNTPLLHVANIEKNLNLNATVLVKLEYLNPAGSIKDRAALSMINDAEKRGILHKGSVIIEPTSGNTGIGLAAIAAAKGYKVILTMPETMSVERRKILSNYGATIILTPGGDGMNGAIKKAEDIASSTPGSFLAGQFINPANPAAHINTTGPEIWNDTDGLIDIFIAGVGTGGTITGVGEYLKSKRSSIQVIAVEPASSPVLSGGTAGKHGLQGIGAGFIPDILNTSIYDEIYKATEEEAINAAKMLATIEGISVGITSGASLSAAINYARKPVNSGKTIVALLPDSGDRYYSTALFD
jgi:cysteine synthase A